MIYLESIVSRANITKLATVETVNGVVSQDSIRFLVYMFTIAHARYTQVQFANFSAFRFPTWLVGKLSIAIFNKELVVFCFSPRLTIRQLEKNHELNLWYIPTPFAYLDLL